MIKVNDLILNGTIPISKQTVLSGGGLLDRNLREARGTVERINGQRVPIEGILQKLRELDIVLDLISENKSAQMKHLQDQLQDITDRLKVWEQNIH